MSSCSINTSGYASQAELSNAYDALAKKLQAPSGNWGYDLTKTRLQEAKISGELNQDEIQFADWLLKNIDAKKDRNENNISTTDVWWSCPEESEKKPSGTTIFQGEKRRDPLQLPGFRRH